MGDDARWLLGLEEEARARLPAPVFEYVAQGAGEGWTASLAVEAWRAVVLHPHVMRDVSTVDLSVTALGGRLSVPWAVAPTTLQRAVHPDGELATARATADVDGLMVVSSNAGTTFADIGATGVSWWLQAYLPTERDLALTILESAVAAGAAAVVLTVDTPVVSTKRAAGPSVWDVVDRSSVRLNFGPAYDEAPGAVKARDLTADDVAWLGGVTGLPVVVKGVLRPDDAARCLDAGAAAIWVSNHGGRQLDRSVSTPTALSSVVAAVGGRAQVYVDGGVRSGLDVVTGLALGADLVFVGRLPLYALTDGVNGVRRMHAELERQTIEAMRLSGSADVRSTRSLVEASDTQAPDLRKR